MHFLKKVVLPLSVFLFQALVLRAQDAFFSQQHAARLYLNPAYAGLLSEARATLAYRNQWPSLPGNFVTNQLSGDIRFEKSKSAAGVIMQLDEPGNTGFRQFELSGIYSYHTRLAKKIGFSAALQATVGSRRLDFSKFTFGDQLTDDGLQSDVSAEANLYEPVNYASIGAGGLIFGEQAWFGLTLNHLNQPDLGNVSEARLPLKAIVTGGYKFYAHTYTSQNRFYELSFTPTLTYTRQGPFQKLDAGFYTQYTPFTVGILYRGIPLGTTIEQMLVFVTGVQLDMFKIGYSYDLGLTALSAGTGGAHEITFTVEKEDLNKIFKIRARNKNYLQIACPAF